MSAGGKWERALSIGPITSTAGLPVVMFSQVMRIPRRLAEEKFWKGLVKRCWSNVRTKIDVW